jgi:hypothetical protein
MAASPSIGVTQSTHARENALDAPVSGGAVATKRFVSKLTNFRGPRAAASNSSAS